MAWGPRQIMVRTLYKCISLNVEAPSLMSIVKTNEYVYIYIYVYVFVYVYVCIYLWLILYIELVSFYTQTLANVGMHMRKIVHAVSTMRVNV